MVRTLLIHEYRRVMLRDPLLPKQLLPQHWPRSATRLLCRNLYRLTQRLTEQHLMATLQTPEGPLPQAAPYFFARFGGLAQADAGGAAPTAAAAVAAPTMNSRRVTRCAPNSESSFCISVLLSIG